MTVTEFFGPNIIRNLAIFLGIPSNKIKIASAAWGGAYGRRRKRSMTVGSMIESFEVEIVNEPKTHQDTHDSDDLSYEILARIGSTLLNQANLPVSRFVLKI